MVDEESSNPNKNTCSPTSVPWAEVSGNLHTRVSGKHPAAWALEGEQAEIPITGNRDKRVLFGVLNPRSGAVLLHSAEAWNQGEFQDVLSQTRSR